jgi:hypothetical protein
MAKYLIPAPEFEGRGLAVVYEGWQGEPCLVIDGRPAARGQKPGQYLLTGSDGQETLAQVRFQNFGVTPIVVIDNKRYKIPTPVRWYGWLLSALPFFLIVIGGPLGALAAAVAFVISIKIFRSEAPISRKILFSFSISTAALVVFEIIQYILLLVVKP